MTIYDGEEEKEQIVLSDYKTKVTDSIANICIILLLDIFHFCFTNRRHFCIKA